MPPENGDLAVEILPPDGSLLAKVGAENIDGLFSRKAEAMAQNVLKSRADDLRAEMIEEFAQLETEMQSVPSDHPMPFSVIVDLAFSIKAKAGLAGHKLLSEVGRSLYLYCEARNNLAASQKTRDVVAWHIQSIRQLIALRVTDDGGVAGAAIRAEMAKLA